MSKIYSLIILLLIAEILNGQMPGNTPDTTLIPLDPKLKIGRLSNGFTYYIRENDNPKSKVEMYLIVKAGILHEDKNQMELAHLIEHLAFNGTKHYPGNTLREYFDKEGLNAGNDWNAFTELSTYYSLTIPTGKPELLNNCFQILRDWAQDISLDSQAIDDERGVILSEFTQGQISEVVVQAEIKSILLNHPKFPVDWADQHIKNIRTANYNDVIRYYKDWYRPDLQAVIVVGDIDVGEVENKIKLLFADLKMPENPRKVDDFGQQYSVNLINKNRYFILTDKERSDMLINIFQKKKGEFNVFKVERTYADIRNARIEELFNEMVKLRLENLKNTYNTSIKFTDSKIEKGAINQLAQIDALQTTIRLDYSQSIEQALKETMIELERVAQYGFLPSELSTSKVKILKDFNKRNKEESGKLIHKYFRHFTDNAAAASPEYEAELTNVLINEITLNEVNSLAKEWIGLRNSTDVVIMAPESKKEVLPREATVFKWIKEARLTKVKKYHSPETISEALVFDKEISKVQGKIINTESNNEIGTTELELSNGVHILLKPIEQTEYSQNSIELKGFKPRSRSSNDDSDYSITENYAGQIVNHSGFGRYNKFQIDQFLKQRDVSYMFSGIERQSAYISARCKPKSIESMLQMIYLAFTSPRKDPEAFEDWLNIKKKELEQTHIQKAEDVLYDVVKNVGYNYNQGSIPLSLQNLNKIDFETVHNIYKSYFSTAAGFTFVISGNFDPEIITPLLIKYLGALPGGNTFKRQLKMHEDSGVAHFKKIDTTLYFGANNKADVQLHFPDFYTPDLKNDLLLRVLDLAVQNRMKYRLREKESGTYTVAGGGIINRLKNNYNFSVVFSCAPDNVKHMIAAALDEFRKLKDGGIDEDLFQIAKAQLNRIHQNSLRSSDFWSTYLKEKYLTQEDATEILKVTTMVSLLTLDEINKAAETYLSVENIQRFVRLPESYQSK